ncbi:TylF/MycF family methyltransferase [Ruminococcaceae bacterium OttesenSCG-928-O06]|nr:TylF/MycF family methyltransferase [Ruminococcaceae bacterium OttesenSCG-928-O06]
MKTIVILGAGQAGRAAAALLNASNMQLLAFGDNAPAAQNATAEVPVLPVAEALARAPDLVLISVVGEERRAALRGQVQAFGYEGEVAEFATLRERFNIRTATLKRLAQRIGTVPVPGAMAELGVYQGDFAHQMNRLLPQRTLYLFDTFEGFPEEDIHAEMAAGLPAPPPGAFAATSEAAVLARMPHPQQVVVKKGHFPKTAHGVDGHFCLVSLDADLYAPTLAGLEFFWPRLCAGGYLLLHDYDSPQYPGVKLAVQAYEARYGPLPLVPLPDVHGTAVLAKP